MRSAKVKDERLAFALEYEAEVPAAAALHKWHDPSQANAGMKVRVAVCEGRCLHRRENLVPAINGNAL